MTGEMKGVTQVHSYVHKNGNNYTSVNLLYAIVIICGLMGSFTSSIFIMMTDRESCYFLYFLLPLGFAFFLLSTLMCDHRIHKSIMFWLFIGLYFLKLVITPAISAMGGWYTLAKGKGYASYLPSAILLSIWESVFIGLALIFYTRMHVGGYRIKVSSFRTDNGSKFDGADFIVVIGTLFIIFTLLYYPPLRVRFAWLLTIGTNQAPVPELRSWRDFFVSNGRQVPLGIIDTLMMKVFYVVRVLLPALLIEKIYQKRWGWKKKAILSLFMILICAQITTEANGETILMTFAMVITLFMIYPKFYKKYGKIVVLTGMIAAGILFMLKIEGSGGYAQNDVSSIQKVSATMNAYMNGPINLAIAIKAKENYTIFMGIEEVLGGLPLLNRFFREYQTSTIFNEVFWGVKGRTDQLLPSLGQGYMYFGFFFAPLLQFFFLIMGMKLEDFAKTADSNKVKGYFLFLAVVLTWTIGNNLSHVLGYFLRYLPGIIILYFKKYRIKLRL